MRALRLCAEANADAAKGAAEWEEDAAREFLERQPETNAMKWPEEFKSGALAIRAANVAQAIRLSKHRSASADSLKKLVERYIGGSGQPESASVETASTEKTGPDRLPLRGQIEALRMCVENTAPSCPCCASSMDWKRLATVRRSQGEAGPH